jgi:hypothetical protein
MTEYQQFANEIDKASKALAGKTIDKIHAFKDGDDYYCLIYFTDGTMAQVSGWAYWAEQITGVTIKQRFRATIANNRS